LPSAEIIDRPKQGVAVRIYKWFFDRLGDRGKTELMDFCDQPDYLEKTEVLRLLKPERDRSFGTSRILRFGGSITSLAVSLRKRMLFNSMK